MKKLTINEVAEKTGRDFVIEEKMAESVTVIKVCVKEFTAKAKGMPPDG